MFKDRKLTGGGFTLIELLIVVAIIAILAAIAVPNFLEAQTRSKVGRVKADVRSLVTALEAYKVDTNKYPDDYVLKGGIVPGYVMYRDTTMLLTPLTTPVAWMSSIPITPFGPWVIKANGVRQIPPGKLIQGFLYTGPYIQAIRPYGPYITENTEWELVTQGPIPNYDWGLGGYIEYDPSNGTVSRGLIMRYGP